MRSSVSFSKWLTGIPWTSLDGLPGPTTLKSSLLPNSGRSDFLDTKKLGARILQPLRGSAMSELDAKKVFRYLTDLSPTS